MKIIKFAFNCAMSLHNTAAKHRRYFQSAQQGMEEENTLEINILPPTIPDGRGALANLPSSTSNYFGLHLEHHQDGKRRSRFKFFLLVFFYVLSGFLFLSHYRQVLEFLDSSATSIKQTGFRYSSFCLIEERLTGEVNRGVLLMTLLMYGTTFPFVPGYGTMATFCGFVYGFPGGFIPAFFGAQIGAVVNFWWARRFGRKRLMHWLKQYPSLMSIISAVNRKGFKVTFFLFTTGRN